MEKKCDKSESQGWMGQTGIRVITLSIMVRRCGVVVRCGCNCGGVGFAWVGLKYRVRARWKLPLTLPVNLFFPSNLIRLLLTPLPLIGTVSITI